MLLLFIYKKIYIFLEKINNYNKSKLIEYYYTKKNYKKYENILKKTSLSNTIQLKKKTIKFNNIDDCHKYVIKNIVFKNICSTTPSNLKCQYIWLNQ